MDPNNIDLYMLQPVPALWDAVGIFFITFCAIWTTLLLGGMAFLVANRQNPIIKVRGLPLSLGAIGFLHCYWILGQIVYPIGRTVPVVPAYTIQYFFMGIWFPLGIALFHASNTRFLYVAKMQKQFIQPRLQRATANNRNQSLRSRWRNLSYPAKTLVYISVGMVLQVLLTVGMWLACRKYHPTFGIPGTELRGSNLLEQLIDMGRGWEWWPSLLWQGIWTWIVAPILIYRAWGIRDTLGWRLQTIGCCIASLHATPMFLVASYVPAFIPINAYFTPSEWIHLSVMMFEVFTVFVPCWLVIRQRSIYRKSRTMTKCRSASSADTMVALESMVQKTGTQITEITRSLSLDLEGGDRLLTMKALDYVLDNNPAPLQEFSSLRDFSGENIAFLTSVKNWRESWPQDIKGNAQPLDKNGLRQMFTVALSIYTDFVGPRDAEFPVNISSTDLRALEAIFEGPTRNLLGAPTQVNEVLPFKLMDPDATRQSNDAGWPEQKSAPRMAQYMGEIPPGFGCDIFDAAHQSIKYLVLTNTWPKFVGEMQKPRASGETDRTDFSYGSDWSGATLKSSVSTVFRSIFK